MTVKIKIDMKNRLLIIALIAAFTASSYVAVPFAQTAYQGEAIEKGVTPYGDYCPSCSDYGVCRKQLKHEEAVAALRAYFNGKGLTVRDISVRHRFLKANVYRGNRLVDRVIFDKKTGRIRSIY
ncbi:MAG: hypothetical protein Q8J64_00215 [Thermodesulfovibrionales bacterium]|nr:hypothetical protein [Thermodesulfovibrionales bacterium]